EQELALMARQLELLQNRLERSAPEAPKVAPQPATPGLKPIQLPRKETVMEPAIPPPPPPVPPVISPSPIIGSAPDQLDGRTHKPDLTREKIEAPRAQPLALKSATGRA